MQHVDKTHLQKIIYNAINTRRKTIMNSIEYQYLQSQIKQLSQTFIDKYPLKNLVSELSSELINQFKTLPLEPKQIDMHEVLKQQIGTSAETQNIQYTDRRDHGNHGNQHNHTKHNEHGEHDHTKHNVQISTICNMSTPAKLQYMFNPKALETKAYVQLDRRFQSGSSNNTVSFTWELSNISAIGSQGVLSTSARVYDIVSIKMFPFIFPITPNAYLNNRLTVTISEFASQSYSTTTHITNSIGVTSLTSRQFHFEFVLNANGNTYLANDIGQSPAVFEFYKFIEELRTITISFGNPFVPLVLQPDRGICTISPLGITSLLTFTTNTFLSTNDLIYVLNFTTTDPQQDTAIISLINSQYGHIVTVVSATEVTINIDISDLVGTPISNINCYFDSKRFAPRLEFTFRRPLD